MKTKTTLKLIVGVAAFGSLFWQGQRQLTGVRAETIAAQASRDAVPGNIFNGTVLAASGSELRLNITPCGASPTIVVFREPFRKTTKGSKDCGGGRNVTIEQIQKL